MKQFIHHRVQMIDGLIDSYNHIRQLHVDMAFEFDDQYRNLLKECKTFLKSNGTNTQVGEVLNLEVMFETAKKGINPYELKKVKTGRRSLSMMIANQGLNELFNILKEFYDKEKKKIEEAEELLSNTILGMFQSGSLNDEKIEALDSIPKIEAFWNKVKNRNDSVLLIDKKLRIKIISQDIFLIIEKILNRLR